MFEGTGNGILVKMLDPQSGATGFKSLGGSKVDSAFHPSEVDQMSPRNSRRFSGKKYTLR